MSTTQTSLRELLRSIDRDPAEAPKEPLQGPRSRKAARDNGKTRPVQKQQAIRKGLLDSLFDRIAPFYLADASGRLVTCSKAFHETARYLFSLEEDGAGLANTPDALIAIFERLHKGGGDIRRSDTVEIDGNERHLISTHFSVRDSRDRIIGFGGIYEDVSTLARTTKKAGEIEGWLQDVIRSSSDWLWAVDHNCNLTFVSPRISEAIGTPAQALAGRHLFSLGQFDSEMGGDASTRRDMELHRPFRNRTLLMRGPDGETRHVLVSGVPVFNESTGRFEGYRGTGTDVTQRLEAERSAMESKTELERALKELRKRNDELLDALEKSKVADRAKIDFLAMMSHELRTPLNCVIGFSDAAIQKVHGPIDDAYLDYFQNIHKAGSHLLELINDILDTANIEAKNVAIEVVPVRVTDLVDEATNMVDPKIRSDRRVLVEDSAAKNGDLLVLADRLRARQILVNLLSNAIKFTPDDGKVGIEIGDGPDDLVNIAVWDTGIGIAPDEQERIFDPFYQVEKNVLSREVQGTGLGLAISRQLAQLMKGDLTVESKVGEGTRFTLSLPKAESKR